MLAAFFLSNGFLTIPGARGHPSGPLSIQPDDRLPLRLELWRAYAYCNGAQGSAQRLSSLSVDTRASGATAQLLELLLYC